MNWYKTSQFEGKPKTWYEDSEGKVMWVKGGGPDSVLNYWAMKEAIGMTSGSVVSIDKDGNEIEFIPPFYKKEDSPEVQKNDTSQSISVQSPSSQEAAISPRQVHMRDDVIQNREDLAPSMLRKKRKSL